MPSIFDTPISLLPDPLTSAKVSWLMPVDDENLITRKLDFGSLVGWIAYMILNNNFLPWDSAATYSQALPTYVSYGGNIWLFVSGTSDVGTVPGTDSSIWQLVSTGLGGGGGGTGDSKLLYSLPTAIGNDVNFLGLYFNKQFNWAPNLGTWGAQVGDKIVHRALVHIVSAPGDVSFGGYTEFGLTFDADTKVDSGNTPNIMLTVGDLAIFTLEQLIESTTKVRTMSRIELFTKNGDLSNLGRAIEPEDTKSRFKFNDYNPTNILTTPTPWSTQIKINAANLNSIKLVEYNVTIIKHP
jgi:hypothetical protein